MGYAEDGEGVSVKTQRAEVKKVLGSVHKMNQGGNVVVLDGGKSYTQNKKTGQKTRIGYEEGQCVMYLWVPAAKEAVKSESDKILKGNRYATLAVDEEPGFSRQESRA